MSIPFLCCICLAYIGSLVPIVHIDLEMGVSGRCYAVIFSLDNSIEGGTLNYCILRNFGQKIQIFMINTV